MDRCPRPQVISCFYLAQFNTGNCCIFGISSTDLCCWPRCRFHSDPVYFSGDGFWCRYLSLWYIFKSQYDYYAADFIRFADIWYRKLLGAVNLCSEPWYLAYGFDRVYLCRFSIACLAASAASRLSGLVYVIFFRVYRRCGHDFWRCQLWSKITCI